MSLVVMIHCPLSETTNSCTSSISVLNAEGISRAKNFEHSRRVGGGGGGETKIRKETRDVRLCKNIFQDYGGCRLSVNSKLSDKTLTVNSRGMADRSNIALDHSTGIMRIEA